MNRRNFLKYASTGIVSSIVLNKFNPLFAEIASSGRNISFLSKNFRKGIPTFCNLCPAHCGILGFIDKKNWLAGIQGNPLHPNNRGKICARGIAGMNLVYDPERQLFPLKRSGARGQGQWKKISWDEALSEISSRLTNLIHTGREAEIVFNAEKSRLNGINKKFIKSLGRPTLVPSANYFDPNKATAQLATWGERSEIADVENSDYILIFGANPFESHPQFINISQRIIEAKFKNGAKVVTFDPRMSNTAGRSDEWLPIYPGADGIVALAMAQVILKNKLFDAEFITNWTNVSVSQLQNYLSAYTPEKAAAASEIEAAVIERIALDFASRKAPVAISGSGISQRVNGVDNERAIMLLNAVVGNIDKKGGYCLPRQFDVEDFESSHDLPLLLTDFFSDVERVKQPVDTFISILSNPVYESPHCEQVTAMLRDEKKVPLLVVVDHALSETASLADIFLPAATLMESWDLSFAPSFDFVAHVTIGQPIIHPFGDSLPVHDILLKLAQKMGGNLARKLDYRTMEDYIKEKLTELPGFDIKSDYKKIIENGIWSGEQKSQFQRFKRQNFKTKTGKFEIVSTELQQQGGSTFPDCLSNFNNSNLATNQLHLIPFTANVMPPDMANAKWLSEISHTNAALINPKTARRLRIQNNQKIKIKSKVGELEIEAKFFQGIHPKVVAIKNGSGHWAFGRVAQAKKFTSADPDTDILWWEKQGNGENPNILVDWQVDPVGKGHAWKSTVVTVYPG